LKISRHGREKIMHGYHQGHFALSLPPWAKENPDHTLQKVAFILEVEISPPKA